MFFKRFWQIFSFKNCFTPQFVARKPARAGSCISQRAVAFQSGPDAKNRPALKGSSANQIASFSLIKNKSLTHILKLSM
jgi:hypothetical protein